MATPQIASAVESSALALRNLHKRFNRQVALDSVDLTLQRGEIHGLVGENGSGKSTLIKVLAGFYTPDEGELFLGGERLAFTGRRGDLSTNALAFVHQDLGLVVDLTVAENLALTNLASPTSTWRLSQKSLARSAAASLARYQMDIDPLAQISSLAAVDRAKVAIVRALTALDSNANASDGPRILVLDEPTVFLPRQEVDRLFESVHGVAASGASVLFVSHDLDEVWENCDTLTVLRDGRVAGHRQVSETSVAEMVELIVGRKVDASIADPENFERGEALVKIKNASGASITELDLDLGPGEILGVTGLAGSGFEELPYLLYGARPARSGSIAIGENQGNLARLKPLDALGMGMILVPGDRRRHSIVGSLSVTDNVTLPQLGHMTKLGLLRRRHMVAETRTLMDRFDIRPRDPALEQGVLSGGNQQKGVLAKWLSIEPKLILLDEPTQGVDIGAREQIYAALRAAASRGASVLCASSDYAQLAALCHRVVVLRKGVVVAQLHGANLTKSHISEACLSAGSSTRRTP